MKRRLGGPRFDMDNFSPQSALRWAPKETVCSNVSVYAASNAETPLAPFTFDRRDPGPNDVEIKILFCGVCHSDLHTARNEWQNTIYPCIPGHEIVGEVTRVGKDVTTFQAGRQGRRRMHGRFLPQL